MGVAWAFWGGDGNPSGCPKAREGFHVSGLPYLVSLRFQHHESGRWVGSGLTLYREWLVATPLKTASCNLFRSPCRTRAPAMEEIIAEALECCRNLSNLQSETSILTERLSGLASRMREVWHEPSTRWV